MTVEPYRPAEPAVTRHDTDSWVDVMSPLVQLSEHIATTDFVPRSLRGKPAAVAACVLMGRELGLGPMQSLSQIYVVEGKPGPSAELARALVLSAGHQIRYDEMTNTRVVVSGRRRGEQTWTTVTYTMDDAKTAGLAGRDTWRKYPRRMLTARATGELCRLVFADVLGGMPYLAEELEDEQDGPITEATPVPAPARRTAQRRTGVQSVTRAERAAAPVADVPEPDLPEPEPAPAETGEAITDAQLRKLHAVFGSLGIKDRDEGLRALSFITDRDVDSSKSLTKAEASTCIDHLDRLESDVEGREAFLAVLRPDVADGELFGEDA